MQLVIDDVKDSCKRFASSVKNLLHVELTPQGTPKFGRNSQ